MSVLHSRSTGVAETNTSGSRSGTCVLGTSTFGSSFYFLSALGAGGVCASTIGAVASGFGVGWNRRGRIQVGYIWVASTTSSTLRLTFSLQSLGIINLFPDGTTSRLVRHERRFVAEDGEGWELFSASSSSIGGGSRSQLGLQDCRCDRPAPPIEYHKVLPRHESRMKLEVGDTYSIGWVHVLTFLSKAEHQLQRWTRFDLLTLPAMKCRFLDLTLEEGTAAQKRRLDCAETN